MIQNIIQIRIKQLCNECTFHIQCVVAKTDSDYRLTIIKVNGTHMNEVHKDKLIICDCVTNGYWRTFEKADFQCSLFLLLFL